MSYITDIFAFQDWIEYDSSITPNEIALWYALVRIFNKLGNPEELSIPISTLIPKCKLSRNSIYKSRNRLKQLGLIDFKDRKGNQSSVYRTIKFRRPTVEKNDVIRNLSSELDENGQEKDLRPKIETQMDTQSDTQSDTQMDTQSDTQMDTQRTPKHAFQCALEDPLKIKNKNKNKIKESISKDIPKKSGVDCLNFDNRKSNAVKNELENLIENYTENEELRLELNEYLKIRKAKKVPTTERAIQLNLNKLSKLADNDEEKIEIVQRTIEHGWTSFFPSSEGKSGVNRDGKSSYDIDAQRRFCRNTIMHPKSSVDFLEALKEQSKKADYIEVKVT